MRAPPATVSGLLREGRRKLADCDLPLSPREAYLLLGLTLGRSEAQILAAGDEPLTGAEVERFRSLLERRLRGEPFAYLKGVREFWGRPFRVDHRVLVPRPETELLVEIALDLPLPPRARILDLGTGSGCLAITLALELRDSRVVAVDRSLGALAVARENARRLGAPGMSLVGGDWAAALRTGDLHLVVANPPYIDPAEAPSLSPEVTQFEPGEALFSSPAGTSALQRLLRSLSPLQPGAWLLTEIGCGQGVEAAALASAEGFQLLEVRPDLAGHPRTLVARRVVERTAG